MASSATKNLWQNCQGSNYTGTFFSLNFYIKPEACNITKEEILAQLFFCVFREIFKDTFFTEHLRMTASEYKSQNCYQYQWLSALVHSVLPPLFLQVGRGWGWGDGKSEKFSVLAKRGACTFWIFSGEWIFSGGGGGDFLKVIFNCWSNKT